MPSLRTREADRNASRCAHDGDGNALRHPLRRDHLLGTFAERFLEGGSCVGDVDEGNAARHLGRVVWTNSPATRVGVRKQVVLAAWHGETRLERPAQNLGAPCLRRSRVGASQLGVRDPTVEAPRRDVTRWRRARGLFRRRLRR
jgi:hypothetical protein